MYSNTAIFKPEPVAAAAPAGAFLIDDVGVDAVYAISLRKLRAAWTGDCIRVRRESDSAEQDFGFDGNGDLDIAAVSSFCVGTNGRVTTWYDQSGNGFDFVQATGGSQPLIYDSTFGIMQNYGGKTALRGSATSNNTGTGTYFMNINALMGPGSNNFTPTVTSVVSIIAHNAQGVWTVDLGNGYSQSTYAQSAGNFGSSNKNGVPDFIFNGYTVGDDVIHQTVFYNRDGGSGASKAYTTTKQGLVTNPDISYTSTSAGYNSVTYQNPTIFRYPVSSLHNNVFYNEQIFWSKPTNNTTLSAGEKQSLLDNINSFYTLQ